VNASTTIAHLCGSLGQALAVVDGETWLYERKKRRRPTSNEIRFFFQHGMEVRPLDPSNEGPLTNEKLFIILEVEERCFGALHNLLVGMDAELNSDLRRRAIRAANRLLATEEVTGFVETRFLRPVARQNWDLLGALDLSRSEKLGATERLYTIASESFLQLLEDEIMLWARAQNLTSVESAANVDAAYDSYLIAAVATSLHDGNPVRMREKIFFAKNRKWNRQLATHLVAHFSGTGASSASRRLSHDDEEDVSNINDADIIARVRSRVEELLDAHRARKRREGRRHRTDVIGAEAYDAALKQVEWITRQFETGHSHAGWNSVIDLAQQQLAEGDTYKLAMSLTNLSTRLMRHGEVPFVLSELATMCAFDDPAVSTARAELFRDLGQLAEALTAYDRTVQNFPHEVYARNGRAETLRALGRFDDALAAYDQTVKDFPQDAVARSGRAETLRALGRFDEALAAYDQIVKDFPQDAFARNGYAGVLSDLGKFVEARAVLKDVELAPRTASDWIGIHILCMIDFRQGPTAALAQRLEQLVVKCPYPEHRLYFETTLVVVRIALKRMREARATLKTLAMRPELNASERTALQLMEAHAEAADGDLGAAQQSLAMATNVVTYEEFRLRRLRQEVIQRFGLGSSPPPTRPEEIAAADASLVRIELDFWAERAAQTSAEYRRAA
jgi:tetratricopeptide (TPR) repeat protein